MAQLGAINLIRNIVVMALCLNCDKGLHLNEHNILPIAFTIVNEINTELSTTIRCGFMFAIVREKPPLRGGMGHMGVFIIVGHSRFKNRL